MCQPGCTCAVTASIERRAAEGALNEASTVITLSGVSCDAVGCPTSGLPVRMLSSFGCALATSKAQTTTTTQSHLVVRGIVGIPFLYPYAIRH